MIDPAMPPLDPERDLLAAELAFGLLDGAERLEAEKLRLTEPAFAAAVARWERHALTAFEGELVEEPSDAVWQRIEAGLARRPAAASSIPARRVDPPVPANDPGLWRPFAIAASLAAVLFAGLWAFARPDMIEVPVRQPLEPQTLSVAQINAEEEGALLSALYDRESGRLFLRLAELPDPARVPQLWLIDDGGTPRSLGFGQRGQVAEIELTPEQRAILEQTGTIAVSLEPPSATPGNTPTDVLGAASLAPLDES